VDEEHGGKLIYPAVVKSDAQAGLLGRREVIDAIDAFLDDPGTGVRRGRPQPCRQ
jgi:hypothetical protein